jgi:hypothetical protein
MSGSSRFGPANYWLARLTTAATLVFFLAAQPAVMCLPLCLSQSHHQTGMSQHMGQPCHSTDVVRSESTVAQTVSVMLPSSWLPAIPPLRVMPVAMMSPDDSHLYSVPPQDPPPPRLS